MPVQDTPTDPSLDFGDYEAAEADAIENMGDDGRAEHDKKMEEEDTQFAGTWVEQIEGDEFFENIDLSEEKIEEIVDKIIVDDPPNNVLLGIGPDDIAKIVIGGLDIVKDIAKHVTQVPNTENSVSKLETLSKVFTSGKTIGEVFQSGVSDVDQLKEKIDEVVKELQQMETNFLKSLNDLVAQIEIGNFRSDVMIPTQTIFDRLLTMLTKMTDESKAEFVNGCRTEQFKPNNILSAMKVYVCSIGEFITPQLKAHDYAFATFNTWSDQIILLSARLAVCHVFYSGLVVADDKTAERAIKVETQDSIRRISELIEGLEQINVDRMKKFHSEGFAAKELKRVFDEKLGKDWKWEKAYAVETFPNVAKKMAEEWKNVNGAETFYIAAVRGVNGPDYYFSNAAFYIGDKERVSVATNVITKDNEGVNIVLIQPVTADIIKAHQEKINAEVEKKVTDILTVTESRHLHSSFAFDQFQTKLEELDADKKPLLMIYSITKVGAIQNEASPPQKIDSARRIMAQSSTEATKDFRLHIFEQHASFLSQGRTTVLHKFRLGFVLGMFHQ